MTGESDSLRPAVFLDRDGTIIRDVGYLSDPEQVELLPGAAEALAQLREQGLELVVISNQSGVGRGLLTAADLDRVHQRLEEELARHAIELCGAYHCPHAPWDDCTCRKPLPGMIVRAAEEGRLDLGRSFMVGDAPRDVAAGRRAGCRTILLGGGGVPEAGPGGQTSRRGVVTAASTGEDRAPAQGADHGATEGTGEHLNSPAQVAGSGAAAGAGEAGHSPDEIPDLVAADWVEAASWILAVHQGYGA